MLFFSSPSLLPLSYCSDLFLREKQSAPLSNFMLKGGTSLIKQKFVIGTRMAFFLAPSATLLHVLCCIILADSQLSFSLVMNCYTYRLSIVVLVGY